jgi:hypothetical protein
VSTPVLFVYMSVHTRQHLRALSALKLGRLKDNMVDLL